MKRDKLAFLAVGVVSGYYMVKSVRWLFFIIWSLGMLTLGMGIRELLEHIVII